MQNLPRCFRPDGKVSSSCPCHCKVAGSVWSSLSCYIGPEWRRLSPASCCPGLLAAMDNDQCRAVTSLQHLKVEVKDLCRRHIHFSNSWLISLFLLLTTMNPVYSVTSESTENYVVVIRQRWTQNFIKEKRSKTERQKTFRNVQLASKQHHKDKS